MKKKLSHEEMLRNPRFRRHMVKRNFEVFIKTYFHKYITHGLSAFHKRWINYASDLSLTNLLVTGFRNSGKSTILSHLYPLWAIIGVQQIKNIVIVTYNIQKAKQILLNIRHECEKNTIFKKDLGPFEQSEGPWNSYQLYFPNYNAWITIISTDQSPRGFRTEGVRPELIICDDLESLDSVKTRENRDKLYTWLKSELIPAGSENARFIIIGTPLHVDSLFSRIKNEITSGEMLGTVDFVPILDELGEPTWKERYSSRDDVLDERKRKGIPEVTWRVEYMLEAIADDNQIIRLEHIKYYDPTEPRKGYFVRTIISVDPASTANPNSDYSGVIEMTLWRHNNEKIIYIEGVHNLRLEHKDLIIYTSSLAKNCKYGNPRVYIEDVGFQNTLVSMLEKEGISAESHSIRGRDKKDRLIESSLLITNGNVLFPLGKSKILVDQLIGFGIDRYDDLVDSLTQGILVVAEEPTIGILEIAREDMANKKNEKNKMDPRSPGSMSAWVMASGGPFN